MTSDIKMIIPVIPSFDIKISDIPKMDNIIIIGSNISKEFPILSIYLREAVKNNSTKYIPLFLHMNLRKTLI